MRVGHFDIPGYATRRDYAVYVMVARHRETRRSLLYIGKTGDNRTGCNPVISRVGNHFSFNKIHSQMRNKLPVHPEMYEFRVFYITFGEYVDPRKSREGIDMINEMERQLNKFAQQSFRARVINPYKSRTRLRLWKRREREALATADRIVKLEKLIDAVKGFVS